MRRPAVGKLAEQLRGVSVRRGWRPRRPQSPAHTGSPNAPHKQLTPLHDPTHHTRRAPDVSRGVISRPDQHLQGPVLPCLDVFSEVLVLHKRNVLLNSLEIVLKRTIWKARANQSSFPLHLNFASSLNISLYSYKCCLKALHETLLLK